MTDMGTLASQPTYVHSEAKAINGLGLTVGYVARFFNSPTSGGAAVIWDQQGAILDLNTVLVEASGWNLQSAEGINDKGQIVGYGQHNGVTRAFLLTPHAVPEPAALGLLGIGGAGLGLRSWLRRGARRRP